MTKEQTKKYLAGYLLNMARVQLLKRKLEVYAMSAPSIKREIDICIKNSGEIEEIVNSCNDILAREVAVRKYIYGQSLEKIAEELNYSVRQIQRIHNKAVEELCLKIK